MTSLIPQQEAERIVLDALGGGKAEMPAYLKTRFRKTITTALSEARREVWEEAADLVKSWHPQASEAAKQKKHITSSLVHALHRRSRAHDAE